jgi:hypothetical protein
MEEVGEHMPALREAAAFTNCSSGIQEHKKESENACHWDSNLIAWVA